MRRLAPVSRMFSRVCAEWPFDADLLRRHDRAGPPCTSYPTTAQFRAAFDEHALRAAIRAGNEDPIPRRLSLNVHVPLCAAPSVDEGWTRVATRDNAYIDAYLIRLQREIEMLAPLFDRDREVVQLHVGGGAAGSIAPPLLAGLVDTIGRNLPLSQAPERDICIEFDPCRIDAADVPLLAQAGFNRASLGLRDVGPDGQIAVKCAQDPDAMLALIAACRASGFRSINVDLACGLPEQTEAGLAHTLAQVLRERPDRLAILERAQPQSDSSDRRAADRRLALLGLAVETLCGAGYCHIGMDQFALPGDDLAQARRRGHLHCNPLGYSAHAQTDLLGVGVGAISRVGETCSQSHCDRPAWEVAIDAGRLPLWRGLALDADDRLRADVIQGLLCQGRIDVREIERQHGVDFVVVLRDALQLLEPLRVDGIVEVTPTHIAATPRGRGLLRAIARCFDRHLQEVRRGIG